MSDTQESRKVSKAAGSTKKDVASVGLRRGGEPAFAQNKSLAHRAGALGNAEVKAHGLKRAGNPRYASYSAQSEGYDIGRNRIHEKSTSAGFFNSKHPGTVAGNTKRAERAKFARNTAWNGPDAQA